MLIQPLVTVTVAARQASDGDGRTAAQSSKAVTSLAADKLLDHRYKRRGLGTDGQSHSFQTSSQPDRQPDHINKMPEDMWFQPLRDFLLWVSLR
jgi:hypothetical protein